MSTTRMRPPQPSTGQTETSTAKTRRRSQDHGWREGGGGSRVASLASNNGSCGSGLGGLASGDDLGANGRVSGEDAVVADHVESGRWDEGGEPDDEVQRVE